MDLLSSEMGQFDFEPAAQQQSAQGKKWVGSVSNITYGCRNKVGVAGVREQGKEFDGA